MRGDNRGPVYCIQHLVPDDAAYFFMLAGGVACQVKIILPQKFCKRKRFVEVYVDAAIFFLEKFSGIDHPGKAFGVFLAPFQLMQVGAFFQDPVIADEDRYENKVLACPVFISLDQNG